MVNALVGLSKDLANQNLDQLHKKLIYFQEVEMYQTREARQRRQAEQEQQIAYEEQDQLDVERSLVLGLLDSKISQDSVTADSENPGNN